MSSSVNFFLIFYLFNGNSVLEMKVRNVAWHCQTYKMWKEKKLLKYRFDNSWIAHNDKPRECRGTCEKLFSLPLKKKHQKKGKALGDASKLSLAKASSGAGGSPLVRSMSVTPVGVSLELGIVLVPLCVPSVRTEESLVNVEDLTFTRICSDVGSQKFGKYLFCH